MATTGKPCPHKFKIDQNIVQKGPTTVYKLPVVEIFKEQESKNRVCLSGDTAQSHKQERVIMMVGETGSGKTTVIDSFINHIYGVKWNDDYRLKLIHEAAEDLANKGNEAISQTAWLTAYKLYTDADCNIPYNLTILDTPGFGDTRGIDGDKQTMAQIKAFFCRGGMEGIDHLDAVCFVVQAPCARLTPSQRFIFDSILSIFGKDVSDNIFILITFSDGKRPPCLDALKEAKIPFQKNYRLNNCALFESNQAASGDGEDDEDGTELAEIFWNMGSKSVQKFFTELMKAEPKSLQLTKEVLKEREKLEAKISSLQPALDRNLHQMHVINQEEEALERFKDQISQNKEFSFVVDQPQFDTKPVPSGQHTTHCQTCNHTCHDNCVFADDADKERCCAMDRRGYCENCPGGCYWKMHRNLPYIVICNVVKVTKTNEDMKRKYHDGQCKAASYTSWIKNLGKQLDAMKTKAGEMVAEIRKCLRRLGEIALKPDYMTNVQYIKLLIESEKQQAKPGFEARIKMYQELMKRAETIGKVQDGTL